MDDIQKKIIREITEITFNFAGTSLGKSEGLPKHVFLTELFIPYRIFFL